MARYLDRMRDEDALGAVVSVNVPFTSESHNNEDGCVYNCLGNDNLSITGIFSKRPGVLVPHEVQL